MLITCQIKGCRRRYLTVIITLLLITTSSFSQEIDLNQKINVNFENTTLEKILDQLSIQTGIKFSYSPRKIDAKQKLSITADNILLEDLLVDLFEQAGVEYEVVGGYMVLKKIPEKPKEKKEPEIQFYTISGNCIRSGFKNWCNDQ